MSGQIFISYRREDSSAWAGRLSDRLKNHLPSNKIFMDVDTIDPGVDFVEAVEEVVSACDVLIAVIGNRWLTSSDRRGTRRLDIPEDLVRLEIATALKRGIRVVPVLVEGATMPEAGELPDNLKALVRRNALEIGHTRFDADSERLVNAVGRALEKVREKREEKERQEAEQLQKEEQERQRVEPQAQVPSSVPPDAPSTPSAKPDAGEPSAETTKVVDPRPQPAEAKPVEPKPEKPAPAPSGGTGRKSLSKPLIIAFEVAAAVLVGVLIYLAFRSSKPLPNQTASVSTVTRNSPVFGTPTVEKTAAPTPMVAAAIPSPSINAASTKEELPRTALDDATKDRPWVNSLGMKFVPVAGTQVLFSIWDTRVQDFRVFVEQTGYDATGGMDSFGKDGWKGRGATWREPGFKQGPSHPVVGVNWVDATWFCSWLTEKEHAAGQLPPGRSYRLPTDAEWSTAVGLDHESTGSYPWGEEWPPPKGAGNFAGEEAKNDDWWSFLPVIEGYNDGYARTSPVGSFAANRCGLYDMGGNVRQWCEDWLDDTRHYRVIRGSSWCDSDPVNLRSAYTWINEAPANRSPTCGFRCVVARESSQ